ncbi:MAG: beta-propeller domain-containing protein [Sporichthyaceae bacterium]|nr:beta-propeller domain-containing protein [Sporichthyaceae bacterium]
MFTSVRTAALIAAGALATTSCTGSGSPGPGANLPAWVGNAAAVARLVTYDTCDEAVRAITAAAASQVGPYGLDGYPGLGFGVPVTAPGAERAASDGAAGAAPGAPAAPPAAAEEGKSSATGYSGTNVHEAGVDEPDLVKTDGRRLLTVTDGVLRIVDVAGRRLVGELRLPSQSWPDQILLSGDHALLIARGTMYAATDAMADSRLAYSRIPVGTELTVVDITAAPTVLSTIQLDGDYVDARQVGSVVRIALRSYPKLEFTYPGDGVSERAATRANRKVVQNSTLSDWVPDYRQTTGGQTTSGELTSCDAVHHVRDSVATTMLSVVSLDLAGDVQLQSGNSVSIATSGDTVYGTGQSLYVAEGTYSRAIPLTAAAEDGAAPDAIRAVDRQRTRIHKFDITAPGRPRYVASGAVTGSLLNQYSMSEHDGALRVATTVEQFGGACCATTGDQSQSAVTVLAQRDDRLVPIGAVDGLGKGERIYAVRFVGPVGYVVTFRQTDPLYTIDLSDPTRPRVAGELKINGYSAYLHPAGPGLLIGVGQDATDGGQTKGTQVSLFDVSNPAAPHRVANYHLSGASSEAEFDPHAFLYWPADQTIVVPVQGPYTDQGVADQYVVSGRALVLRLNGSEIDEVGMLTHQSDQAGTFDYVVDASIRRAVVIGDALWTVSAAGVLVSDLQSLDGREWIRFPQQLPKQPPTPVPLPEPWPLPEPLPVD